MSESDNEIEASLRQIQGRVVEKLERDFLAAEMKLALLVCALESYRYDSVLRPFPAVGLRHDGSKDVQKLAKLCNSMPKLPSVIKEKQESSLSIEGWQLLDWLMGKTLDIVTLDKSVFKRIENKTGQASYSTTEPDFVFEVKYHKNSSLNKRFEELAESHDILYAYHGSSLDNFHSILHNGLHSHLNKNSLFGEGTYLSNDLNVSMPYSKYTNIWKNSTLGCKMSCIAVCELLDHPDVKCTLKKNTRNGDINPSVRARAKNSEGGDVPERYYVVTNNELLRIKYLLVYVEKRQPERSSSWSWFTKIMICYIFILVILGFTRTRIYSAIHSKMFGTQDHSEL